MIESPESRLGSLEARANGHDATLVEIKAALKTILFEQRKLPGKMARVSRKIARSEIAKALRPPAPPQFPPPAPAPAGPTSPAGMPVPLTSAFQISFSQKIIAALFAIGIVISGFVAGSGNQQKESPRPAISAPATQQQGVQP